MMTSSGRYFFVHFPEQQWRDGNSVVPTVREMIAETLQAAPLVHHSFRLRFHCGSTGSNVPAALENFQRVSLGNPLRLPGWCA